MFETYKNVWLLYSLSIKIKLLTIALLLLCLSAYDTQLHYSVIAPIQAAAAPATRSVTKPSPSIAATAQSKSDPREAQTKARAAAVRSASTSTPNAPACSRLSISLTPSAINLSGQNGLVQQLDSPMYYQIYGYTPAAVLKQLQACSPPAADGSSDFAGVTNYYINSQYQYTQGSGVCSITSVAVGVHVTQIEPLWNNSPYAQVGYAARWQAFARNLQTHEDGHKQLDAQYASKLLNDISVLPPTLNCDDLQKAVNNIASVDLAALDRANDAYDAATNHGALQGAVIPR